MNPQTLRTGALVGLLISLPFLAISYAGEQLFGMPFVPFLFFDWLARVLPGGLVTFGIDVMVDLIIALNLGATSDVAKLAEQIMAVGFMMIVQVLIGVAIVGLGRRLTLPGRDRGALIGLIFFLFLLLVTLTSDGINNLLLPIIGFALLAIGSGRYMGYILDQLVKPAEPVEINRGRRNFLTNTVATVLGITVGAWGIGRLFKLPDAVDLASIGAAQPVDVPEPDLPTELDTRLTPAPGTRPEHTPTEQFYRIDINTRPLVIDGPTWELAVAGLFDSPRNLTLADLMALPAITTPLTLSCISNRIGGDLIGTTQWTGVRLAELLASLGLQDRAQALYVEARDGFYETVSRADMEDPRTLLVYAMDGKTLEPEHGFPLRIYIPNRYGMKQPKWITRIEALEQDVEGYWVKRGWDKEARPHIISVIDTIATDDAVDGLIPVGGIAWAGDRAITKVEVQVNEGEWQPAELRQPTLSALTWVQWRYDWPEPEPGRYTLTVRATDHNNGLQIAEQTDVRWDGATGLHSRTVTI